MAPPPLLNLRDIGLTFGGRPLLDGAEMTVSPGERLGLVGRNGSGKSTLLKIAAGAVEADHGERFIQPGATIRYLAQEPDLSGFENLRSYVEAGLAPGDDVYRATYLLQSLGLTGDEKPGALSGGETRRAALARALAPEPDILLLDEPTNHLDLPAIEWLEAELKATRSALVLISHDRRFLQTLTRATLWLDRGKTRRLEQGFGAFEAWRDEAYAQEERDRHKLDRKIEMEKDWLRYGVTARRKRNMGRMRALDDLREKRRSARGPQGSVKLAVTEGETSGALVIEAKRVSKAFDRPIVVDFSARIARGDRIGLVGANGAGKTTLLNLLTGVLAPDEGVVKVGANVQVATIDQKRASLDPEMTLRDALTGGKGDTVDVAGQTKHVMSYMKDFLFGPEQAGSPVRALSGGERGRLLLARALAQPANLLVLDEPTNDLDLETLDLLQEMIGDYPGTILLVSHDRDFLDRTVGSVIASEGDGRWVEYAGGYADMVAQRGRGVDARASAAPERSAKAATPAPSPAPTTARKKLSFKDQHALDTLPKEIARLEGEITKLAAKLADPALYAKDPNAFATTSDALATAEAARAAAEDRWLELEMLREELAAG